VVAFLCFYCRTFIIGYTLPLNYAQLCQLTSYYHSVDRRAEHHFLASRGRSPSTRRRYYSTTPTSTNTALRSWEIDDKSSLYSHILIDISTILNDLAINDTAKQVAIENLLYTSNLDYLTNIQKSLSSSPKTLAYFDKKRREIEKWLISLHRNLNKVNHYKLSASETKHRELLKFIFSNISYNDLSSMLVSYFLDVYGSRKLLMIKDIVITTSLIKLGKGFFKKALKNLKTNETYSKLGFKECLVKIGLHDIYFDEEDRVDSTFLKIGATFSNYLERADMLTQTLEYAEAGSPNKTTYYYITRSAKDNIGNQILVSSLVPTSLPMVVPPKL